MSTKMEGQPLDTTELLREAVVEYLKTGRMVSVLNMYQKSKLSMYKCRKLMKELVLEYNLSRLHGFYYMEDVGRETIKTEIINNTDTDQF